MERVRSAGGKQYAARRAVPRDDRLDDVTGAEHPRHHNPGDGHFAGAEQAQRGSWRDEKGAAPGGAYQRLRAHRRTRRRTAAVVAATAPAPNAARSP